MIVSKKSTVIYEGNVCYGKYDMSDILGVDDDSLESMFREFYGRCIRVTIETIDREEEDE
jgi:hypothetical protein